MYVYSIWPNGLRIYVAVWLRNIIAHKWNDTKVIRVLWLWRRWCAMGLYENSSCCFLRKHVPRWETIYAVIFWKLRDLYCYLDRSDERAIRARSLSRCASSYSMWTMCTCAICENYAKWLLCYDTNWCNYFKNIND